MLASRDGSGKSLSGTLLCEFRPTGTGIEDGAPRHDRKEKNMVENTAREEWIAPDFTEFETPTEVTGYAGRVN